MNTRKMNELAVVPGLSRTLKTLSDGTLRFALEVDPDYRDVAMQYFSQPGTLLAVARLNPGAEKKHRRKPHDKTYRTEADALQRSDFFHNPKVWRAIGTNAEFLSWLRQQPCAHCEKRATNHHPSEIAHIGIGGIIKPEYGAIALCYDHVLLRKSQGSRALGSRRWFEKERLDHVYDWASDTLLQHFKKLSWMDVKPYDLKTWAISKQVATCLPAPYGLAEDD